jgi:CPA1 family monovalent cation:H+ antiporter
LVAVTAATTVVLVAARFAWVFPAVYLPRWLSSTLARRDPAPPWQWPFFLAFTGVRGVVSLAAALSIPLTLAGGAAFPYRSQIFVATFGVIIVTLVGMGSLLPTVIRWLGLARGGAEERQREHEAERNARSETLDIAERRLLDIASERNLPEGVTAVVSAYHANVRSQFPNGDGGERSALHDGLRLELIDAERRHLHRMLHEGRITDESRRRVERELDLEEAALVSRAASAGV